MEAQLNSKLACNELEDSRLCTIQPGPKGDRGREGPRGPTGEKGTRGQHGEKGERGQSGVPGDNGAKGQMGNTGLRGPVGPKGDRGVVGPAPTLGQSSSCSWHYTDTCGHSCGAGVDKHVKCPVGQYVAGIGITTWNSAGRYNNRMWCCPV